MKNLVSRAKKTVIEHKNIWRWILFIVFLFLFLMITQNTMKKVAEEISEIPLYQVLLILLAGAGYQFMDAWSIKDLASSYNSRFTLWQGIQCTYTAAFYRVISFGSGSGLAAMYFLERNGIEATGSVGIVLIQYSIYKFSMGMLCILFYILEFHFFQTNFSNYNTYIFIGLILILVISFSLLLLCVSKLFHDLVLKIAGMMLKSKNGMKRLEKMECDLEIMRIEGRKLLKQRGKLVRILLKNILRILFWLLIPYLLLQGKTDLKFFEILAIGSFTISLAGVIPTPAGIGSIEALMISFFGTFVGIVYGGSIVVMYRFSTYLIPSIIGFFILLSKGNIGKIKK